MGSRTSSAASSEETENKHSIGAALQVIIESRAVGPDESPRTPDYLTAKTVRTTIRPKSEDENPEAPINTAAKTAKAAWLGVGVTPAAEFGFVRPA